MYQWKLRDILLLQKKHDRSIGDSDSSTITTFNLYSYVSSLLFLIKPLPAVKIDTDIELGRKGESTEIGTTETGVANKEDKNARPGLISVPRDNQLNYVLNTPNLLTLTHTVVPPTNQPGKSLIS